MQTVSGVVSRNGGNRCSEVVGSCSKVNALNDGLLGKVYEPPTDAG
jgi:hypothetical protein